MFNRPDYKHIKCDSCGGIIGMYVRGIYTCDGCGTEFKIYQLDYDRILVNHKTGWAFPVKKRED